ncbi:MAG TPA: multiheme c-type cytochrome [Verrucomicrobiae bacterium]|nr:multiheme c-type cytochrome [Verrucomicrobiae bacterium]
MTINRVMQNEYSIWIVRDKHSKAYGALTGMVGERMANLLGLGKAETAPRCLACHALDVPASERAHTFEINDGVSCESCHGPASGWLGRHTERNWTHEQSLQLGMYDTRDLIKRSEKCLSCHLGSDQKYVDHEMIAAGHPDLYFELDSFSATMPRHWREPDEPGEPQGSDPWYDVREWTTGQAVQLREGLLHLESRAHGKIWPEYSEQECYACHHSLVPAEQSWRQARGYPGRQPGNPPWNASRYMVFREIVREMDPADAKELDGQLVHLTALMSTLNPNRDEVASTAASSARLADAIAHKLNGSTYDSALTVRIFQQICSDADPISNDGEHSAAQAAMALQSLFVAYNRNEKMQNADEVRAAINGLFDQLQSPSNYDGPRFAYQMRRVSSVWH